MGKKSEVEALLAEFEQIVASLRVEIAALHAEVGSLTRELRNRPFTMPAPAPFHPFVPSTPPRPWAPPAPTTWPYGHGTTCSTAQTQSPEEIRRQQSLVMN